MAEGCQALGCKGRALRTLASAGYERARNERRRGEHAVSFTVVKSRSLGRLCSLPRLRSRRQQKTCWSHVRTL